MIQKWNTNGLFSPKEKQTQGTRQVALHLGAVGGAAALQTRPS